MPIVGRCVKHRDVRFIRGDSVRFGFQWSRRNLATGARSVVDAAEYTGDADTPGGPRYSCVLELRSPDGSELWLSRRCDQLTVDGYVTCLLLASLFTGAEWLSRASGQYLFRVTDAADGSVGTMCWGYFALTD